MNRHQGPAGSLFALIVQIARSKLTLRVNEKAYLGGVVKEKSKVELLVRAVDEEGMEVTGQSKCYFVVQRIKGDGSEQQLLLR